MQPVFFPTSTDFRNWLEQHSAQMAEQWVGFYKKDSGKPSITWPEAVDEALCFGWIDGLRKSIDGESYAIRFTPRKPTSIWSRVNTERATELKRMGRMTAAGLALFEGRDKEKSSRHSDERATAKLTQALERRFRANKKAWEFFQAQPPSYRRVASWWVISAKKVETQLKRLDQLIQDSARGRRSPALTLETKRR